jgi:hypothetical protein
MIIDIKAEAISEKQTAKCPININRKSRKKNADH